MDIESLTKRAYFSDKLAELYGGKREKKTVKEILADCPKVWGQDEIYNQEQEGPYITKQTPNSNGDNS